MRQPSALAWRRAAAASATTPNGAARVDLTRMGLPWPYRLERCASTPARPASKVPARGVARTAVAGKTAPDMGASRLPQRQVQDSAQSTAGASAPRGDRRPPPPQSGAGTRPLDGGGGVPRRGAAPSPRAGGSRAPAAGRPSTAASPQDCAPPSAASHATRPHQSPATKAAERARARQAQATAQPSRQARGRFLGACAQMREKLPGMDVRGGARRP